jgi:hypothetical protein
MKNILMAAAMLFSVSAHAAVDNTEQDNIKLAAKVGICEADHVMFIRTTDLTSAGINFTVTTVPKSEQKILSKNSDTFLEMSLNHLNKLSVMEIANTGYLGTLDAADKKVFTEVKAAAFTNQQMYLTAEFLKLISSTSATTFLENLVHEMAACDSALGTEDTN